MGFKEWTDLVGPQLAQLVMWVLFGVFLTMGWLLKRGVGTKLEALERIPSAEWFKEIKTSMDNAITQADHKLLVDLVAKHTEVIHDHDVFMVALGKTVDNMVKIQEKDHERISLNVRETDWLKAVVQLRDEPRDPLKPRT